MRSAVCRHIYTTLMQVVVCGKPPVRLSVLSLVVIGADYIAFPHHHPSFEFASLYTGTPGCSCGRVCIHHDADAVLKPIAFPIASRWIDLLLG